MAIRKPKPTSPGRRFSTYPDFAEITKTGPEKTLVEGLKKTGGRNANGRKTSRHRGGGAEYGRGLRHTPKKHVKVPLFLHKGRGFKLPLAKHPPPLGQQLLPPVVEIARHVGRQADPTPFLGETIEEAFTVGACDPPHPTAGRPTFTRF